MDLAKLTNEKQLQIVMNNINAFVFKQMHTWFPEVKDSKSFTGGTILFTQLLLQDAITQLGKSDNEIDHTLEGDALTLLSRLSLSGIIDIGGENTVRLQARCKKLKGVSKIGHLELWEIPYWLSYATLQDFSETSKMLQSVSDWLQIASQQTLEYINQAEINLQDSDTSLQFDFGVPNLDSSVSVPTEKSRRQKKSAG